jgi:phage-related protein
MTWTVLALNTLVEAEIDALPADMRARLSRLTFLIQQVGFDALPRHTVKHLEDKLWELRLIGKDGISRAIYLTASGKRMIIVRVFIKKSQKTPSSELDIARKRAKDIK